MKDKKSSAESPGPAVGTLQAPANAPLPSGVAPDSLYGPAMGISDPAAARAYLDELVVLLARQGGLGAEQALELARANLGYFAGYRSHEVRLRVERLFGAVHPVFGTAEAGPVDAEVALALGQRLGMGQLLHDGLGSPEGPPSGRGVPH